MCELMTYGHIRVDNLVIFSVEIPRLIENRDYFIPHPHVLTDVFETSRLTTTWSCNNELELPTLTSRSQ